jgi:hypothetical protein
MGWALQSNNMCGQFVKPVVEANMLAKCEFLKTVQTDGINMALAGKAANVLFPVEVIGKVSQGDIERWEPILAACIAVHPKGVLPQSTYTRVFTLCKHHRRQTTIEPSRNRPQTNQNQQIATHTNKHSCGELFVRLIVVFFPVLSFGLCNFIYVW